MTPVPIVDTTVNIWDYYFRVRVPYLQSRSVEEVRRYGTTLTGVREIDDDIQNQWMTTMMPIARMVEHFQEGTPIRVVLEDDVKLIYQFISEHIHAWKVRLQRGINIGDAPIDDLIAMDQFANTVYDQAKYQFTPEIASSFLVQQMAGLQRFNSNNFGNLNSPITPATEFEERDSLSEFFKTRLINLNRR